jgi:transposase-like protein
MKPLTHDQHRQRVKIGWAVVREGGTTTTFAKRLGISKTALHFWFARHGHAELKDRLQAATPAGVLGEDRSDKRARLVAEALLKQRSLTSVAQIEGVSLAAISAWKKDNWMAVEDAVHELTQRKAA